MILHGTLVDADIPHHNKMQEAIITHWQMWFKGLKLELSVYLNVSVLPLQLTKLQSKVLLWANQFHSRHLVKHKYGGLLGIDLSLGLPQRIKWVPYT
jgi:hypothetical protein